MWEMITLGTISGLDGTLVAWLITGSLLLVGLVGCALPILPGHLIIVVAAVVYRMMLGAASGLSWWSVGVLILLSVISQTFEVLSGAAGTKWFGGTRWGALGALAGGIAGMFFLPLGLIIGPLLGAVAGEMIFAKKSSQQATISGIGSVVGTLAGMIIRLVIGVLMVVWFFLDVFLVGK